MKKNLSNTDRIIRLVLGIVLAILYFTNVTTGTFGLVLLIAGIIVALTSIISFCPIYAILGISTNSAQKSNA